MTTSDQKALDQTEKKGTAKAAREGRPAARATKSAVDSRPAKEANPARASLLDVYFGEGAARARKDSRVQRERPRPEGDRRPTAEVVRRPSRRPAGETAAVAARPPVQEAPPAPLSEAPEAAGAEAAAPSTAEQNEVEAPAAVATTETGGAATAADGPVVADATEGPEPAGRADQPGPADTRPQAEIERPRPAGLMGPRSVGRPAAAGAIGGPRPFSPRPVAPAPPPAQRIERPAGPSRLGRPLPPGERPAPVPGAGAGRNVGAPRAFEQRAPRPAGPGGADRGPRSGGGFGPRGPRAGGAGGRLVIPKVDPKVAEQPEQRRETPAEQKKKPTSHDFEQRRREAQKPSEEKLFGRRVGRRSQSERRSLVSRLVIEGPVTVKELAHEMGVTASEVIKKLLVGFGVTATINQPLDTDTAVLIGQEFGTEVEVRAPHVAETLDAIEDADEDESLRQTRPPVVVVMGHVDHGKTTLLDAIREARVAAGEAGGITQHIGAYVAEVRGKKLTFLDTPGHEAFTAMRARGAQVTDIAILVVAADDGVMPQTIEAINHARAAHVPMVVAINKIDKENANAERVKQELTQHGIVVEEWGGDTIAVPVSAKNHTNLDQLLEMLLLVAEVQDIKANPNKNAGGTVLEAQLDKARGPVATVLVQAGTLHVGDSFVAGGAWGKVRAMFDDRGRKLKKAGPSTPIQVMGFASVPEAGDVFRVVADEKVAREVADKRSAARRAEEQQATKVSNLEDLMARVKEGETRDLNIIIKGDVQGSVEAVRGAIEKLRNEEAQVRIVHSGAGAITESDVMLASASKAMILGFNVRPDDRAQKAATAENVEIRTYRVIYEAVDEIKAALMGMLSPKFEEVVLGKAEVRELFKASKIGVIAGCMVQEGKVQKNAKVRLIRDGAVVWEGHVDSLRRFKDDVREVTTGMECGILLENYKDIKQGDIIEAFVMQEIRVGV